MRLHITLFLLIIFSVFGQKQSAMQNPTSKSNCTETQLRLNEAIDSFVKLGLFNGVVLVVNNESVLIQKGYGFNDYESMTLISYDTKFRIGSITKQFTALAILQLSEKNLINIDADIRTYLPEFPIEGIKIRNLLTQSSGLPIYWNIPDLDKNRTYSREKIFKKICRSIGTKDLHFTPGERFEYIHTGFELLSLIIERISGTNFESYLKQNIFDRIGMSKTGCSFSCCEKQCFPTGYILDGDDIKKSGPYHSFLFPGASSLFTTAEDLYKWDRALTESGKLLSKDGLIKLFTPQIKASPDCMKDSDYAFGWFITNIHEHLCAGHFGKINGFRTGIFRYPNDNTCIIILSNFEHAQVESLNKTLSAILFDYPYKLPQPVQEVIIDYSILSQYEGLYTCGREQMHIFKDETGKNLYVQITGHSKQKLIAQSNTTFVFNRIPSRFEFISNSLGHFDRFTLEKNGKIETWKKI